MNGCISPNIGVLDSGIGGLSVLREIHRLLPGRATIYVADQQHLPYGPRPLDEIHRYVDGITRFLRDRGAGVVVLACHAASAAALYRLRESYPEMPFVGIEPALKPAVAATRRGTVGVLTTQATADGPLYQRVVSAYAGETRIITRIAPALVTLAERSSVSDDEALRVVRQALQPLLDAGVDEIVLACTHFPFLAGWIGQIAGPDVALVDPGPAVARQVERVFPAFPPDSSPVHRYFTTGSAAPLAAHLRRLLAVETTVGQLRWQGEYRADQSAQLTLLAGHESAL